MDIARPRPIATRRLVHITLLSWLAMLGIDFFVHGGLLATLYLQPSPFLLPPEQAFRRIPLAYVSFLLLAILLVWLLVRLHACTGRAGAVFGLQVGSLIWGAFVLGLLSIASANVLLLLGWWLGQTVELALAGLVAGTGLRAAQLRPLVLRVGGGVTLLVVVTIALQSAGLAPAMRIR
jgi:hypothetical protein